MGLKKFAKRALRKFGLEVHRHSEVNSVSAQLVASFHKFGIDLVLDVGANTGQFAAEIREYGYGGRIFSFEPLTQAHNMLLRASADDPLWEIYSRCAVGDHDGEVEINIAGNSESSSILPMLEE